MHKQSLIAGVGLGLRSQHYSHILSEKPAVPWFEALVDNYMGAGGAPLQHLNQIRQDYPMTFHAVGMSLGSSEPLDKNYFKKLKTLQHRFEPAWVSDHLSWSKIHGQVANDLLPMPYTEESIQHLANRIDQAQELLGQRLVIENVSSYLNYQVDAMSEWAFLVEVVERADCLILLDINNVYVSAINHGFDPIPYLEAIPTERVVEMHLAGYEEAGEILFDTHGQPVHPPVWDLYETALKRFGNVPTLIEWDSDIPAFAVLAQEARIAESYQQELSYAQTA